MSWNGRHWWDMPGTDHDTKKMNFYLFRTGRLEFDEVAHERAADAAEAVYRMPRLVLKSQSNFGRVGVRRSTINHEAEAEAKLRREQAEADGVWRFALRQRIAAVLKAGGGSLRQIGIHAELAYRSLHTFMMTGKDVRTARLVPVEAVVTRIERGELQLRNLHGAHLLTEARSARVPEGYVSYKEFVEATAQARGVARNVQYQYLATHAEHLPELLRKNRRLVYVRREDMEAAVEVLRTRGFVDRRRKTDAAKSDAAQRVPTWEVVA